MKIALISAAWPPKRCGVGDYSSLLADALQRRGATVLRRGAEWQWGVTAAAGAAADLRRSGADVVHVQYPTAGYGRSLVPALLPLLLHRLPTVATLHEFSIFKPYRWPWFATFAYATDAVLFTSDAEKASFMRRMPRASAHLHVVPIGSNIPRGRPAVRSAKSVCYFGLFMPGKGIEAFFALAALLRQAGGWRVALIGAPVEGEEAYAATVAQAARDAGVELHAGLDGQAVGDLLQEFQAAYMPGPGGITGRRGSVLAALDNGVVVTGPIGDTAPDWMRAKVADARTPADAFRVLSQIGQTAASGHAHATAADCDWDVIARRHMDLYATLQSAKSVRA